MFRANDHFSMMLITYSSVSNLCQFHSYMFLTLYFPSEVKGVKYLKNERSIEYSISKVGCVLRKIVVEVIIN